MMSHNNGNNAPGVSGTPVSGLTGRNAGKEIEREANRRRSEEENKPGEMRCNPQGGGRYGGDGGQITQWPVIIYSRGGDLKT